MTMAAARNIFAELLDRVRATSTLIAVGYLPAGIDQSRVTVEPPRDPAHGDMATNAAMVLAKDAGKKPRELAEAIAEKLARRRDLVAKVDIAGPGFINLTLKPGRLDRGAARRGAAGRALWRERYRRRRAGQCRICLGQSDRADACRPLPRRRVRRCAGKPARLRRLQGDARILHQRCRRAGRCARALGLSALSRGARRRHRRDPRRALSRRLSQAGRCRARRANTATR